MWELSFPHASDEEGSSERESHLAKITQQVSSRTGTGAGEDAVCGQIKTESVCVGGGGTRRWGVLGVALSSRPRAQAEGSLYNLINPHSHPSR